MKVIKALLGATALSATAFGSASAQGVELEVTHWWTSGGEAAAVAELAKAFNEKTDNTWLDGAIAGSGGTARPIIIDCDPGQDDAINLMLALSSPGELDVLGITTVAGNVPLALTQRNARLICDLVGREDMPVFAGADRPLVRQLPRRHRRGRCLH